MKKKKLRLNLKKARNTKFDTKKFKKLMKKIQKENEKLLNESEIDSSRLHISFDI